MSIRRTHPRLTLTLMMTALLVTLVCCCALLLAACAYLHGERKSDKGLIGRQDEEIRRLVTVAERWQDKVLTVKGTTPVNQPPPPREHRPPDPSRRVAFTPQQANQRYHAEQEQRREKSAEQTQGEASAARVRELTEEQKQTALRLADEVKTA